MSSKHRVSIGYGLFCLLLGGLWLMHTLEIIPWRIDDYLFSWRFLLVVIGMFIVIKDSKSIFGLLVLSTGAISTVTYFWHLPDGWENFLPPIALIIVGLIFLLRPDPEREKFDVNDANVLNRATVFSKSEYKVNCTLFKGGYLSAMFGSNVVDFSGAHLGKENVILHCVSTFGNNKIIIPQGWDVTFKNRNIIGSTDDIRTINSGIEKEGVLEITGNNFFGKLTIVGA